MRVVAAVGMITGPGSLMAFTALGPGSRSLAGLRLDITIGDDKLWPRDG